MHNVLVKPPCKTGLTFAKFILSYSYGHLEIDDLVIRHLNSMIFKPEKVMLIKIFFDILT